MLFIKKAGPAWLMKVFLPQINKIMMKPLLMCVDDSEMMCQFLSRYFSTHYRVQAFQDAEQAWAWLDGGHFPQLIILDLKMPKTSGFEILTQLKASASFYDIPVIILSSVDESRERVRCLQNGAVDYVIKPFNPDELACRVQFHIQANAHQR